jgi:hypothetical protein
MNAYMNEVANYVSSRTRFPFEWRSQVGRLRYRDGEGTHYVTPGSFGYDYVKPISSKNFADLIISQLEKKR